MVWTVAIGIVHHTTYLRNYDFLFTKEVRRQRDKVSFSVGKSKAFHYGLIAIPGFLNFAAELRESVTAAKYRVGMAVGHGSAFRKRGASVSVSRSWCLDLTL